ncbi:uncharacterized protein DSM5745_11570 [Aspergillus mulundensis]|uniref:Uncharacterized protein n=1 Tax=Aspergillus mulundensis TaxID=1810919 RepID=A0A3D8Q618_9EURO|nr:hypothetical protein DSM5745_11570 [Aspergillus mulundensis]RDW57088.1 hypothetical protein DSM5745_11570 [Aspergillus mulundensis]
MTAQHVFRDNSPMPLGNYSQAEKAISSLARGSRMWADLELAVFYKSCIYESEQTTPAYVLSFGIQKRLGPEQRAATPRLPRVLRDASDAVHPTDVSAFRITSINVRMDYSHYNKQRKRRSQTEPRRRNYLTPTTEFNDGGSSGTYHLSNDILIMERAHDSLLQNDTEEVNLGWGYPTHTSPEISTYSELSTLFLEGLRTLVFGSGVARHRKSQTRHDIFQSLSGIAPSVFKLGYREAMNQRSRLIPSIAKSLTSLVGHSNDQTLKDKLASTGSVLSSSSHISISQRSNNLKTIIKTRLWTMAQKRLYSAPTPKHLKHSSNQLPGADSDEKAQDENLLSETMAEESAYIGDDPIDADYGLDFSSEICPDGSEHNLIFDYEECGDEYDSIMILEDSNTTNPAPFPGEPLEDLALRGNLPAHFKDKMSLTSPYTCTSSVPLSFASHERPDTDLEMLDVDSESANGFPPPPSQKSSPTDHHGDDQEFIDLCEGRPYLDQRQTSFPISPSIDRSSHVSRKEDFDMLSDDL